MLTSILFFATESKYETQLFSIIARRIRTQLQENYSKSDFAIKAMHTSYELQEKRYLMFGNQELDGIKANILHPSTVDLMTGNGACGSYSIVLARILKSNDMKVRIGQMKVNGAYGGHMFVETKTEDGWIVLDPTFNMYFKKANGQPASFADLNSNWSYYKAQLPPGYNPEYSYEDVRYTNWNKIPGVTTSIKSILNFVIGKENADNISMRPFLLRIYNKLFWLIFILWILIFSFTIKAYRRKYKKTILKIITAPGNQQKTSVV
ncbi:MAG: transglutaminase domain-containing protein [Sphingobacteriales bacterium]